MTFSSLAEMFAAFPDKRPVLRFANAACRDAALAGKPGSHLTYLRDTNTVTDYSSPHTGFGPDVDPVTGDEAATEPNPEPEL